MQSGHLEPGLPGAAPPSDDEPSAAAAADDGAADSDAPEEATETILEVPLALLEKIGRGGENEGRFVVENWGKKLKTFLVAAVNVVFDRPKTKKKLNRF